MYKNKSYIGHLLALASVIMFSFNTNFMKMIMPEHIGPYGLVLVRGLVSTFLFFLFAAMSKNSRSERPTRKDMLLILICGAIGIGGNLILYLKGLSITGPIDTMVIRALKPILVIPFSILLLKNKFGRNTFIGIALALAGTIYISLAPHSAGAEDSLLGDTYIFIGSVVAALYLIILKPITSRYSGLTIMKWASLGALAVELPIGFSQMLSAPMFHTAFNWEVWGIVAFSAVFVSTLSYLFTVNALKYISAFVESAYIYVMPIFGTALAALFGIQMATWHDLAAFVLIVCGFVLMNVKNK